MIGHDMDQVPPYLVLKLSQALFQKTPASLAPQERQRVDRVACRQLQIEQKILATPEPLRSICRFHPSIRRLQKFVSAMLQEKSFWRTSKARGWTTPHYALPSSAIFASRRFWNVWRALSRR